MSTISTVERELARLASSNIIYNDNYRQWKYLLESYLGGDDYRRASHLTRYQLETESEYQARLRSTPLENHCKSVISVYNSFLFRTAPERDYADIDLMPELRDFVRDADLDGRNLNNFMKDVSTWASVFGHAWIVVAKPDVGASTRADEIAQGVRPYVSLVTPITVLDWSYSRTPAGYYSLDYFKYIEETNGDIQTVREWYPDSIQTSVVDLKNQLLTTQTTEVNGLGRIPIICVYNCRSTVRGLGISDIADIADAQRFIYNNTSEVEQSIRLDSHPSLVKTPETMAGSGAGSMIHMPENLDPGLKPYILEYSGAEIGSIYTSIRHTIDSIDKMANTGAVRAVESRSMSGVAMETEFQLLNAKLSEKADNLELAEEQMWRIWTEYMGLTWNGSVDYPGSFNIRDNAQEINQLRLARDTATDPVVLRAIDQQILTWMGLDSDLLPYQDPNSQPGRLYPDGSEINANLPAAYQPSTNDEVPAGQNCANCAYYDPSNLYCTVFDAPVRAIYWCAKWQPYEQQEPVPDSE